MGLFARSFSRAEERRLLAVGAIVQPTAGQVMRLRAKHDGMRNPNRHCARTHRGSVLKSSGFCVDALNSPPGFCASRGKGRCKSLGIGRWGSGGAYWGAEPQAVGRDLRAAASSGGHFICVRIYTIGGRFQVGFFGHWGLLNHEAPRARRRFRKSFLER